MRKLLFLLIILIYGAFPAESAVSFNYSFIDVKEIDFNSFVANISSPVILTQSQMETAINLSGERSNNIVLTSIQRNGNKYSIYGKLKDYSIRYNKLFNPWYNATAYETKQIYNVTNCTDNYIINITTAYNNSDRWVLESNLSLLSHWSEKKMTNNSNVWIRLSCANNTNVQIAKYVNQTDAYLTLSDPYQTFINQFYGGGSVTNGVNLYPNSSLFWDTGKFSSITVANTSSLNGQFTRLAMAASSAVSPFTEPYIMISQESTFNYEMGYSGLYSYFPLFPDTKTHYFELKGNTTTLTGRIDFNSTATKTTGIPMNFTLAYRIDAAGNPQTLTINWSAVKPYSYPEPNVTFYRNENYSNISLNWSNNYTHTNVTLLSVYQFTSVNFNVTPNIVINTYSWFLNGVNQSRNFNNFSVNFSNLSTYTLNVTAYNSTYNLSQSINWTILVNSIVRSPQPGCYEDIIWNSTDKAPIMGTGERVSGVTYNNTIGKLYIWIYGHTSVPSDVDIDFFINGVRVQDDDVRTTAPANNRSKWFIVPKGTNYSLNLNGFHHYEWRESYADLNITGCLPNSTQESNINTSIDYSQFSLLLAIIAIAIASRKRK